MNEWAQSRHLPGKFIGSTGARILSVEELGPSHPRYNAWAKKVVNKIINLFLKERLISLFLYTN